jgi:5-methylcytosine-specific restriction endonuclease McrA
MTQDLHQAIANLLTATQKTDATLQALKAEAEAIQDKYDPVTLGRQQFNNWRASDEGKNWKQQQFKVTGGLCPGCSRIFPVVSCFHIDHIQPLSKHPHLAIELNNLRLLCAGCNLTKGSG